MKKLILITLCALLLSACTNTAADKSSLPVFTIEGELPDIGKFSSDAPKRFYKEYTPYFIPSDKYGSIIPYEANFKTYTLQGEGASIEQGRPSYGFCTPEGKIVTDASNRIIDIRSNTSKDGFSSYTVTMRKENGADPYDFETLFIPLSGKWAITIDQDEWVSFAIDGIIAVSGYSKEKNLPYTSLYNYDGELVNTIDGFDNCYSYSYGLINGIMWDENYQNAEEYYVNISGEKVLGPFENNGDFSNDGVAAVIGMDGDAYLMTHTGERLTDEGYSRISSHTSGDGETTVFVAYYEDISLAKTVYDSAGTQIGSISGNTSYFSVCFPKNGDIIFFYSDRTTNEPFAIRLSDGSRVLSKEFSLAPEMYGGTDNVYVCRDDENKRGILIDPYGETLTIIEDFGEVYTISENERYIIYVTSDRKNICIYDVEQKLTICRIDAMGYGYFAGENGRYAFIHTQSGDLFGEGEYSLFDTETGEMIFSECEYIVPRSIDGEVYITVCTQSTSTLYNSEFEIILRDYNE